MNPEDTAEHFIFTIHNILIQDWDPLNVSKKKEMQDEYDSYIDGILDLLDDLEQPSASDIADYLTLIETEHFKCSANLERSQKVAEKIWLAFEDFIA